MRKQVPFDELPEELKNNINEQSRICVSMEGKPYQILSCESDPEGSYSRCIIKNEGIFGIFEIFHGESSSVWINSHETELLFNSMDDKDRSRESFKLCP